MWLAARTSVQAATVVLLARWLGAEGYGLFIAPLAIASFFVPLAGMGLHGIILRDIARDPSRALPMIGMALGSWWRSSLLFSFVATPLALVVLPLPAIRWWEIALLVSSEIFATSGIEMLARLYQAQQQLGRFAASYFCLACARLLALLLYAALTAPQVPGWMLAYAMANTLTLVWLLRNKPFSNVSLASLFEFARQGSPFAIGGLALRLQAEFNKPVLAHVGFGETGNFSAAQRVADLASLPLMALQEALWPRVFATAQPKKRITGTGAVLIALALTGGTLLIVAAPWMPRLLGDSYSEMVSLVKWLAWLPAVQTLRNLGNTLLVALGKTHLLTRVYLLGTLASVILNGVLVLKAGLIGAAVAAYGTEVVVITTQFIAAKPWRKE
jgi:O-antigen/teichoic acid export membrane protein